MEVRSLPRHESFHFGTSNQNVLAVHDYAASIKGIVECAERHESYNVQEGPGLDCKGIVGKA